MPPTQSAEYQRFRRYYQRLGPFLNKHKNSQSTAAIFSLLAISLFGWYAVRPTIQTILFLRREIADKTTVNLRMEEKITSLIEAQAAYEDASTKIPLADEAIPQTSEAVELAAQLRSLALITGASVSAIQVQEVPLAQSATPSAAAPKTDGMFSTTLVLEGPYASVYGFLEGIVTLRRLTTIETISLRPIRSASQGTMLNLTLKLRSYYAVN